LAVLLSKDNVFFDVDAIAGGEDFARRISSEIGKSDAALIFIGNRWIEPASPNGQARIWESGDYVRAEIRAALARPMLVLPVLFGGARMPKAEQLPDDIRALTTRNALPLRHESFDDDAEKIAATVLGAPARKRFWQEKGSRWSTIGHAIGGAIAASLVMLIATLAHFWLLARPLSASIGAPMTMLTLIATVIIGGWIGLAYKARKLRHP
jgi:hypothetical protein